MAEGIRKLTTPYFQERMNIEKESGDMDIDEMNETEDIEWALDHLKEFDNEKQLDLLRREIGHFVAHNIIPSEGWYDDRFEYIYLYSKLDWSNLAKKFHNKDQFIHDTSILIMRLTDELMEERGTKPNFHILSYYRLIHSIQQLWNYYKQVYVDEDEDMMGLISGIKSL